MLADARAMIRFVATCLMGLAVGSVLFPSATLVRAQSPFPTAFMRSVEPGQPVPPDGADVLVVEGVGAGVGGCVHPLSTIVYITLLAVNTGQRTVTEISVQSECSPDINVWKFVLTSLVNQIVAGAPNAGTYWGGVMLDEEDGFWTSSDSVVAYQEINAHVRNAVLQASGTVWYYTQTFSGLDQWDQNEFNAITGDSIPAPQIATDYMVARANALPPGGVPVLVTWSLNEVYEPNFRSLYRATSRIHHPPHRKWNLDLSNCFTNGLTPCGPDSDDDGIMNVVEIYPFGTNPYDADTDDDGCSDGEESGIDPSLGGDRAGANYWDFFDVTGDRLVDNRDTLLILGHFGHGPNDDGFDNALDRYRPDLAKPWRSAEANDGITLIDSLTALSQFGHDCVAAP